MNKLSLLLGLTVTLFTAYSVCTSTTRMDGRIRSELRGRLRESLNRERQFHSQRVEAVGGTRDHAAELRAATFRESKSSQVTGSTRRARQHGSSAVAASQTVGLPRRRGVQDGEEEEEDRGQGWSDQAQTEGSGAAEGDEAREEDVGGSTIDLPSRAARRSSQGPRGGGGSSARSSPAGGSHTHSATPAAARPSVSTPSASTIHTPPGRTFESEVKAEVLSEVHVVDVAPRRGKSEERTGLEDGRPVEDDGSCHPHNKCRPHGFCRDGECICVLSFEGPECSMARELPRGLTSHFEGNYLLTRGHVREMGGVNFTTNPKAGDMKHGKTHTLFAPLVENSRSANRRFNMTKKTGELKSVLTGNMLNLMPEEDVLKERIYESCAIVGSSGLLMIYEDGPAIDSHDCIIRFNSAPTRVRHDRNADAQERDREADFPNHVGAKTSFRFINTQHIPWFEANELRLQQMQSKAGLFKYLQHMQTHPKAALYVWDVDFTRYVSRNIANLPTGGYFAIMFALQKCVSVDVYGFHWRAGHAIPHHYFNSEVPLQGSASIHDYKSEYENIKALAQKGFVNLAQPCVAGCEAETHVPCTSCAPGGMCACGENLPTPLALPGFCHMKGNYTCYYKCPGGEKECPGGPKASRCLRDFNPDKLKLQCAMQEQVPKKWYSDPPLWALAAWDPKVLASEDKNSKIRSGWADGR